MSSTLSALPELTDYTRRFQDVLRDALRRDDYRAALDLAAAAPRDAPAA